MSSPAIYSGTRSRLLTSLGLELSSGQTIDYGARPNLIKRSNDVSGWSTTGANGPTGANSSSTSDLPIEGIVNNCLKVTSSSTAGAEASHYFSYPITMPTAYLSRKHEVSFWMRPGSNFIASEWSISVYAGSTRMALSTDSSSVTYLPATSGKFTTTFDADTSTSYTLRFSRPVNAGGNAAILNLSDIYVGPGVQPQGAVVGPVNSGSLSGSDFTNDTGLTITGRYQAQRVGDALHLTMAAYMSGTGSDASPLRFTLPTIDGVSGLIVSSGSYGGGLDSQESATTDETHLFYMKGDGSNTYVEFARRALPTTSLNGTLFGAGAALYSNMSFSVILPIAQWVGGGTVNVVQNDVMYVSNDGSAGTTANTDYSTGMQYGPAGSQFVSVASTTANAATSYQVNWPYAVNQSSVRIQISRDSGVTWVDGGGDIVATGRHAQGTSIYGMYYKPVSATVGQVVFGNKGRLTENVTYAGDGAAWSGIAGSATFKWRVVGANAGQAIGFAKASQSSLGLVTTYAPTVRSSMTSISSADYTVLDTDGYETILVTTAAANRTITLPTAADNAGRKLNIKKVDSGVGYVIIDGEGAETINGQPSLYLIAEDDSAIIQCDGSNWEMIGQVCKYTTSSSVGPTVAFGVTTTGNLISITLPPGRYLLTGGVDFRNHGSGTAMTDVACGISTSSASFTSTIVSSSQRSRQATYPSTALQVIECMNTFREAAITTSTPFYLIAYATYSSNAPNFYGTLMVQRVSHI